LEPADRHWSTPGALPSIPAQTLRSPESGAAAAGGAQAPSWHRSVGRGAARRTASRRRRRDAADPADGRSPALASGASAARRGREPPARKGSRPAPMHSAPEDRKSTRLNSSHVAISYAVFCLKKKKQED